MPLGYLTLVLHAHLPYVRHPEFDDFLEEDWLYEAITETYVPLLEVFEALERDQVDWRLTMSVTPTLAGMLSDPLLQYRYVRHIDNLIVLAGKELERTRWQPEFHRLAEMYMNRFTRCRLHVLPSTTQRRCHQIAIGTPCVSIDASAWPGNRQIRRRSRTRSRRSTAQSAVSTSSRSMIRPMRRT